ncbi:FecR domain-containing protein [Leptospira biflexa]|uniref:FecR domain-containing protein n=1 Tax=Leptospira biflexa TaxID=172 RepID=UPI001083607D|nr:FecR domain-containing protein [Leptospira biflexa]TGM31675.1 LysM peptidoglycan-binding domain-containing protein [Leptospira biflexa]TGM39165.1 LysM peptidoglycan-binding domain-containing protein [Leptospira biflexa]TGM53935.1 LysM peptidoglycan-binding domain-containing protein [Leptospira biflexa]
MRKSIVHTILVLIIIFCQFPLLAEPEAALEPITITVQKGETLSLISERHLSDPKRWPELLKYNKIPNPDLIKPGLSLVVPVFLRKSVVGVTEFVMGQVEWNGTGGKGPWVPLKLGQELHPNDQIKTNGKGKTDIHINQVGMVRILNNSHFEVKGEMKKGGPVTVALFKGSLDAKVTKSNPPTTEHKFNIVSPSSTAGVRGTEFRVELDEKLSSTISCFEGVVDVNAQGKTVELTQGMATFVEKGKSPVQPYKIPEAPRIKEE